MAMMNSHISLNGIFPTITTPFVNHEVDYAQLRANIEKYNEFDLTGYKLLGSNAEYLGLTPDETIKVLRTVVAANTKKRTLVAGADRESVEAALDFIRIIADIGVDIASVMTPRFYARHMSDDSFVAYYTKIADDSPIPILIYIPPTSSSAPEMSAKALATLSKHENIIAVKVSSKRGISEYRSAVDAAADFLFLGGKIGNIVRDFEAGIVGAILSVADYWPQACIDLYRLFCEEQFDEAHKLCENIYTAYKEGPAKFGVAGVKYAMDLAGFSEKVVPLMAFAYILGSVIIIFMNLGMFLPALKMIFVGAFTPKAIGGGVLGITIQKAVQLGLARGLFSNEAGMGSTPHSHAVASTDHPAEQGFIAMIGVFISTFMICLATVMVNLTSGSYDPSIPAAEMAKEATLMTQRGFTNGFGTFGGAFLSISLASFALTTIIGWYFFAESNVIMLAGDKKSIVGMFRIIAIGFLVVGTLLDGEIIWMLADLFTGLMALPNIVALLFLSGTAKKLLDHYDKCKKEKLLKWPTEDDLK
jgi:dihydrodipicolinate synthase/N-acetylneuraminate lyase